jgi:hypothetical protein
MLDMPGMFAIPVSRDGVVCAASVDATSASGQIAAAPRRVELNLPEPIIARAT